MPRITRLARTSETRVQVDLDGQRWRSLPVAVATESRLAVGNELTRHTARELARQLRRHRALSKAERLLKGGERSVERLHGALAQRGVAPAVRQTLVAGLQRAGLVDDMRGACSRAGVLEERGWGNAAISYRLEAEGFAVEARDAALEALGDERERAETALSRNRRTPVQAARFLTSRGFDPELCADLFDHHSPTEG